MDVDEIFTILGKHYNQGAQEFFWLTLSEDSYTKTQDELRREAGIDTKTYRRLMADARFTEMLDVMSDQLMYASLAQVRNARLAFAKEFSGVSDRKAFLERYDAEEESEEQTTGITIINNMAPDATSVKPDAVAD
jgi:hypothetical protein